MKTETKTGNARADARIRDYMRKGDMYGFSRAFQLYCRAKYDQRITVSQAFHAIMKMLGGAK